MNLRDELTEGRVLPQNIDAERSVLGAMMMDDESRRWGIENMTTDLFYSPAHGIVFDAMFDGKACDLIIVTNRLKEMGELEQIGGPGYLSGMVNLVPTIENTEHYGHIVRDCAIRRQAIKESNILSETAYKGTADDAMAYAGQINDNLSSLVDTEVDTKGIAESLRKQHASIEQRGFPFLETGWTSIDKILDGGIPLGHLTVVVGETGKGKTMFALNLAENWVKAEHNVLFISLEMTKAEVWSRVVGSRLFKLMMVKPESFSYSRHILNDPGCLKRNERWRKEAEDEEGWFIDDRSRITYPQILAQIRYHKRKHNISAVIVDHLGLIKVLGDSAIQYYDKGANDLVSTAKELEIGVVALAHRDTASSRMEGRGAKAEQVKWHVSAVQAAATCFMVGDCIEITKARFATTGIPMPNIKLLGSVATFE